MKLGIYQHYKGEKYEVIGVAKNTEDLKDYVVYRALYDNKTSDLWVRAKEEFIEVLDIQGIKTNRFTFLS